MVALKDNSEVKYYAFGLKRPEYYKYTYESFTQPVMNNNGVWGGSSFAVQMMNTKTSDGSVYNPSSNLPYYCWDQNTSTYSLMYHGDLGGSANGPAQKGHFFWYNFNPLNVKEVEISFANYGNTDSNYTHNSNIFYGSVDGYSWTVIKDFGATTGSPKTFSAPENNQYYQYHCFVVGESGGSYHDGLAVREITLKNATERVLVKSDSSDYDVIVTGTHYYTNDQVTDSSHRRFI